jgi:hypothetical protein
MEALGWQRPGAAHTLTSVRKAGFVITSSKVGAGERV